MTEKSKVRIFYALNIKKNPPKNQNNCAGKPA
jgi:hypothetical protein